MPWRRICAEQFGARNWSESAIKSIPGRMTTTIKVPVQLRERVQEYAIRRGQTRAAVLNHALDLLDREAFFERLASDVATHAEDEVDVAERDAWLAGPTLASDAISQ